MTLEEKAKFIIEREKNNYMFISPRFIQGGATLVNSYRTLQMYESMDENTKKFAKEEIFNLILRANYSNKTEKNYLDFDLIYCGDSDDLLHNRDNNIDFIMNNRDSIVAVYRYVKSAYQSFIDLVKSDTIYSYDYLYLSLATLLKAFEENNVKYEIGTIYDRFVPDCEDHSTRFVISYNPKKEIESERGHQLKKVIK